MDYNKLTVKKLRDLIKKRSLELPTKGKGSGKDGNIVKRDLVYLLEKGYKIKEKTVSDLGPTKVLLNLKLEDLINVCRDERFLASRFKEDMYEFISDINFLLKHTYDDPTLSEYTLSEYTLSKYTLLDIINNINIEQLDNALLCISEKLQLHSLNNKIKIINIIITNYFNNLSNDDKQLLVNSYESATQNKLDDWSNIIQRPFFSNIITTRKNFKESFSYVSRTASSTSKPFTPEQILTSPFIYLSHGVNLFEDFQKIVNSESKYLMPTIYRSSKGEINRSLKKYLKEKTYGDIRYDQYPGLYLVAENEYNPYSNVISGFFTFILSTTLFAKRGWHIRGYSPHGGYGALIDKQVWDYTSFAKHLKTTDIQTSYPEIIYHYPIPFEYIEAIVCNSNKKKSVIQTIQNTKLNNIPVYSIDEFKKLKVRKRIKYLYTKNKGPYPDKDSNLCYNSNGEFAYDRPGQLNTTEIKNTLSNCGVSKVEALNIMKKLNYEEIMDYILERSIKSIRDRKFYLPKVHPPKISLNHKRDDLKIFSWNIDYFHTNIESSQRQRDEIEPFFDYADIFIFQELTTKQKNKIWCFKNKYHMFTTKSGLEEMYTFIKKDLHSIVVAKGEFEKGRPFIMNKFVINNRIVLFINVHPGVKIRGIQPTLAPETLKSLENITTKLSFIPDRLIIAGDFNMNINYVKLVVSTSMSLKANNIVSKQIRENNFTCCNDYGVSKEKNEYGFVDNILDSAYNKNNKLKYTFKRVFYNHQIVEPHSNMGSDHTPIYGILPF